ncbi:PIR Superfamily Protein [Plasmodium ovale wallikeri]|uniref:PIR Superfamily Protein n=1 Tax=Plasmodium ovale wallikeri TaxID=864142 RepID=A0A1A9AMP2_PLAOA|nr:PIR Superfamily Protein [Plasmodium ovale wallikeri]
MASLGVTEGAEMPYLPSFSNYNDLNNPYYRSYGNDKKCEKLQDKLIEYKGIEDICLSLSGIFKKNDKFQSNILFADDFCSLVNYWLYDRVFNEVVHKTGQKKVDEVMLIISNYFRDFAKPNKCSIQFQLCFQDNFKKAKSLFDFATNYPAIQNYLEKPDYVCTQAFNKYITDNINLYQKIEGECENKTKKIFCKLLTSIYSKYGKDKILQLKCDHVQSTSKLLAPEHTEGDSYQSFSLSGSSDPTSGSNTAVASILPLLGISFTFLLYKFTSIGTWINPKIGSIKRVIKNVYEDNDKSINNSENIEIDFEDRDVNMQYHSWGNY